MKTKSVVSHAVECVRWLDESVQFSQTVKDGSVTCVHHRGSDALFLDVAALIRSAIGPATDVAFRTWVMHGLWLGSYALTPDDPVLARLLDLYVEGRVRDPRLVAVLQEHLERLSGDKRPLERWARSLRNAFAPLRRARDQHGVASTVLVVRPACLRQMRLRASCRIPRVRAGRDRRQGTDAQAAEARWLLACDSWRDGARRSGSTLVVHLPAYLLVAQLMGRPLLCGLQMDFPAIDAPADKWFAAAKEWRDLLLTATEATWLNGRDPHRTANAVGWRIPEDVPALCFSLAELRREARGEAPPMPADAPIRRLRQKTARWLRVQYGDVMVTMFRRYSRALRKQQVYYELPFALADDFWLQHAAVYKGSRVRVGTRVFWSPLAINKMAQQGVSGANAYASWVWEQESFVGVLNFPDEVVRTAYATRVADRQAGVKRGMGPFMALELDVIHAFFDLRTAGALRQEEVQALTSRLPGRTYKAVRRVILNLLTEKAQLLGRDRMMDTGWWPGKVVARTIFDRDGVVRSR